MTHLVLPAEAGTQSHDGRSTKNEKFLSIRLHGFRVMADMKILRAAVIGVGHLGSHHARLYASSPAARLVAVADILEDRAREIAGAYGAEAVTGVRDLAGRIDVASVAVPTI